MHENKIIAMAMCWDIIYSSSHMQTGWQTSGRKWTLNCLTEQKKQTHDEMKKTYCWSLLGATCVSASCHWSGSLLYINKCNMHSLKIVSNFQFYF